MTQKQEVAQLRKALEKERCALRSAQDEVAALRAALDSERSAVRALRRDIANQIKKIKEEDAERYTTLIEQFKNRSSLDLEDKVKNQKEQVLKSITAEFQRLQQSREAELHKEATRREDDLRHQLKDALNRLNELTNKSVNSSQPMNSINTNTNMPATSATITISEIQALRADNKQLELRLQELLEAERRNAEKVRMQYEDHLAKEAEQEKSSRRESHILLEKLKSKDRTIEQLEKELRKLKGRLEASCRNCLDIDKPGEPPRLGLKKRLNIKINGPAGETARARCDLAKETNSNDLSDQQSSCDNSNSTNKKTDTHEKEPEEKEHSNELNGSENKQENETLANAVTETNPAENSPVQETDITINSWTKAVGVETLYQVIVAEHQELQRAHQALAAKLRAEQKARADLEASIQQNRSENPINLALAAQIQELTARQAELISENHELREQNDLLEFRLLEIDSAPSSLHFKTPSSPSRSPESRGDREVDDISDSGVLSLPTSEDISETDFHELAMEPNNRDIKSKLSLLCQSMENISDRISIQQGLALLRHYEARLEATLATMSPDLTKSISEMPTLASESTKSQSRIIATVLPFTDLTQTNGRTKEELPIKRLLKDADCLQESGIFEESPEYCCRWTQTDWSPEKLEVGPGGDLSLEIRKLKQIRERIEEQGGNKRLLRSPGEEDQCQNSDLKELLFYRDRIEILENKLAIYESSGDEQIRRLNSRLEKEILLSAQLKHLKERCAYLEDLNRRLEEEKCEFEEAENDTRLRCQKLEVKLSALGEKKSDLQVQLQQNARSLANLKSCLAEEEKKRIEARQHASQMEALVQCYEQRNFELEEKEVEARCKNQMLEGTIPALIVYNTWKTEQSINNKMDKNNHCGSQSSRMLPHGSKTSNQSNRSKKLKGNGRVKEIYSNLLNLKTDLYKDCERLERSKSANIKKKASDNSVINNDDIEGCLNELKPVEEHLKSTFEDLDRTAQIEEEFLLQHSKPEVGRTTTPPCPPPSQSSYRSSTSSHKPTLPVEKKISAQTGRAIASQLKTLKCERDDLEAKIRNLKSNQSTENKDSHEQCSEIQDSLALSSDVNESTEPSQKTNVAGLSQDGKEDLCSQLQKLKAEKDELEDKIKHLELKESYYQETLQQADEMWASMEKQYKDRIQCNESKLDEKQKELDDVKARLLRLSKEKNMSQQLNNRIYCLETEIKDLKFKLAERELDRKLFEKEEHRLCSELAGTSEELNFIKNCTEPRLKQQLSDQKRITEELRKEVEFLERSRKNDAADYSVEVSGLSRKISKLNKEVLENECTISELREEVQTLEIALTELRDKYLEEQDGRERLLIKLTKEIEDKERDIRLLKQKPAMLPKSAKEELEEAENSQIMLCSKNKRSKSERKHKTRCRMTLKKLNEKIKAGLLLDDNQFNSISSTSSGDDSSNEIYVQNTLDFPYRSSLAELSDNSQKYVNNNNSHDLSVNERISDLENDSEGLLDGDEPLSLRLSEEKTMDDDPHVDCEATEVVTSSKSSHEESKNHFEESINEQNLLTENTSETTSSTLRLSSSIKHSTVSENCLIGSSEQ